MNGYDLSRNWFDWAFLNPSKITPAHGILYFFCIEHCNRLGWKHEFGLPTTMAKEAIGIRSYNTYINTLNDLVDWGFIVLIEKSKNQYSSNIIALSNFDNTLDKALDKALIKHTTKQVQSTVQSISSIDKQITNKPIKEVDDKIQPKYNIKELAAEYLVNFNRLFDKSFKSTATIEPLLEHWLKQYTPLEIGEALRKAKSNPGDWTSKMITESPEKILRTKNKNGPCDYIATVLNAAPKKDESVYVYPPLMAGN